MIQKIKTILTALVPEIKKWELKNKYGIPSMEGAVLRLSKNGFNPRLILDIGANKGDWSIMINKIYPNADVIMFEAQQQLETILEKVVSNNSKKFSFHIALLGSNYQENVNFHVNDTVSSVLPEYHSEPKFIEKRNIETLNELLRNEKRKIDFVKLDVQGYELEILKGFTNYLHRVEVILMEVSLLEINKGCPLIHEVINFMYEQGFITYDICSFIRRPLDQALWQSDVIFVNKNSNLIASKKYI